MSVVVVGSINMDTTYRVPHIPVPGETIIATDRQTSRGGKGQNQAVTISRLGGAVEMVGAVGADDNGRISQKKMAEDAVGTDYVYVKQEATGLANIYVDDEKNNNIVVYAGANFKLTKEDIENARGVFEHAKYCVLQMEVPLEVIYFTLELCKELGITTILNPAPAHSEFDLNYLKYVDYFIPNESELEIMTDEKLTQENLAELAQKLLKYGCQHVIVTMGTKGSVLFSENHTQRVEAVKVTAEDTTAAGDSYIGALTTYLAEGKTITEAMNFGSIVAAQTVTKAGAIDSIPQRSEVEEFISELYKNSESKK